MQPNTPSASSNIAQAWLQADAYNAAKLLHPEAGRRKWQLVALEKFWRDYARRNADVGVVAAAIEEASSRSTVDASADADSLDNITEFNAETFGILIRTDFSDEDAWQRFRSRLVDAEDELRTCLIQAEDDDGEDDVDMDAADGEGGEDDGGDDDEDEDDEGEEAYQPSAVILHILAPPPQDPLHGTLSGISNLSALRLLNTPYLRPAPLPPKDTARDARNNPLIDRAGLQEAYRGKDLWIYDTKSNDDMSVRVVNQKSADDVYGSATGDSWRARVGHIYELQYNMRMAGMKVDFGGMDKYEYTERLRNLAEAAVLE